MPDEAVINNAWLIAAMVTFFAKGVVFAVLAWLVHHEHRKVSARPSPLGLALILLFGSVAAVSTVLAATFGVAAWVALIGDIPFWLRMGVRLTIILAASAVSAAGIRVVKHVRDEARRRSHGESW